MYNFNYIQNKHRMLPLIKLIRNGGITLTNMLLFGYVALLRHLEYIIKLTQLQKQEFLLYIIFQMGKLEDAKKRKASL